MITEFALLGIPVVMFFFSYLIKPWMNQKYPDGIHHVTLMIMAVNITLILIAVINAISSGIVSVATYYIILPGLTGIFAFYGIKHRLQIIQKMRRTYYTLLFSYYCIFWASGLIMFWFLPFMPNIVL